MQLTDTRGSRRTLEWKAEGEGATVFYFFDPQSSDCLMEMNFLDALYSKAKDFGLEVFAIEAKGRQPAEVSRSLERYCLLYREPSFAVVPDADYRLGKIVGVDQTPLTILAEPHGVVLSRLEGFGPAAAVELVRRVERLLRRPEGYFSFALREARVDEDAERELGARIFAGAEKQDTGGPRPLAVGEKVPPLEFTDLTGQARTWAWGAEGLVLRVILFWTGPDLPSSEALIFLDELSVRGRNAGLETAAVEAGGLGQAQVAAALERYRKYRPAPSFLVVPDPDRSLQGQFGAGAPLPQVFVIGGDGSILARADGFSNEAATAIADKVERAFRVAGRPLAPPPRGPEAEGGRAAPGAEEAPSIRQRREREEVFRANLVQGDFYFTNWDFDQALTYYQRCFEIAPRDLHVLVRLAQIHERKGNPKEALEFWEKVLAVQPGHTEARTRVEELRGRRGPAD